MMFKPPNHKINIFHVEIKGNFTDSKDSFYSFSSQDLVHITFVKKPDGTIYEEVRELIFLKEIDQFFPSDQPELVYRSNFKSVASYRIFLRKQPLFSEHESFLKKYTFFMFSEPDWGISGNAPF